MSDYFVLFIEQRVLIELTLFLKLVDSQHVLVYHVKFSELLLMSFLHKISIFLKCTNIGAVFLTHCMYTITTEKIAFPHAQLYIFQLTNITYHFAGLDLCHHTNSTFFSE